MTPTRLEADYLIVGSGAVGMAFADILLTETDTTVVMVDRYQQPGGHWNVAYPFVTLHQPSSFYGVSSRELSSGLRDQVGLNKGLADLASGAQVLAYFDDVMRHQFLPSGRLQYFPMCEYDGDFNQDHCFHSMLSGAQFEVSAKKVVDATWLNTNVPSTHQPNFTIDAGARFMPLNDLPSIAEPPEGFVVIGGGKTGIDACLWLLANHVPADKITWIVSRDAWLLNRRNAQPDIEFFNDSIGAQAAQMESIAAATSIEDMFDRLEACGYFLRLDSNHRPSMFHGATISIAELEVLRKIKNVVRLGKVKRVGTTAIELQDGSIETTAGHVHIDCSATAITNKQIKPIFKDHLITPQMVRSYQPVFSAALVAHVEVSVDDIAEKNRLCGVVPLPDKDTDFLWFTAAFMMNQFNWSQDKALRSWLVGNRLDGFARMVASVPEDDTEKREILARLKAASMPAMMNLQKFQAQLAGQSTVEETQ
jgi:hypothetical protein